MLWQQIFLDFGAADFLFNIPLKKVLQNRRFSPLAAKSGFGAAICVAVMHNSESVLQPMIL